LAKSNAVAVLVAAAGVWLGCGGGRGALPASPFDGGGGGGDEDAPTSPPPGGDRPPPDGDDGGPPLATAWEGFARIRQQGAGSQQTVSAALHWTLVSSSHGVDRYRPSGTATFEVAGGLCTHTVEPPTVEIAPNDGELVIDRRAWPATYRMTGATLWVAREVCDGTLVSSSSPVGGPWADNQGSFEGDVIGGGIRFFPEYHDWELRRVGATFPPPAPGECVGTAAAQWTSMSSISDLAAASVTWTLASSDGCLDLYTPAGVAKAPPPFDPCVALSYTEMGTVASGDGILQIDRSTNPPGVVMRGSTVWDGTGICTHADGTNDMLGPPIGGDWADLQGTFSGDHFSGALITRQVPRAFSWTLTRLP
jgi:hypothetical protein